MIIEFDKYDGCGNDFIFINGIDRDIELTPEQVVKLCDRHFGIGADGVIIVQPSKSADGFMNYINADSTLAQMCGNGVRCFAKYLVDNGIVDPSCGSLVAQTRAGLKNIEFTLGKDGKMTSAKVDMGLPILNPCDVPTTLPANTEYEGAPVACSVPLDSPWGSFAFTCVSMGNPHAVCFFKDIDDMPDELFNNEKKSLATFNIDLVGSYFESNPVFPEKANIEFAVVNSDVIEMRVFERGCGETLACGTGACATSVAATLAGIAGRHNIVRLLGGDLDINWAETGHVLMSGPAEMNYSGIVEI